MLKQDNHKEITMAEALDPNSMQAEQSNLIDRAPGFENVERPAGPERGTVDVTNELSDSAKEQVISSQETLAAGSEAAVAAARAKVAEAASEEPPVPSAQ